VSYDQARKNISHERHCRLPLPLERKLKSLTRLRLQFSLSTCLRHPINGQFWTSGCESNLAIGPEINNKRCINSEAIAKGTFMTQHFDDFFISHHLILCLPILRFLRQCLANKKNRRRHHVHSVDKKELYGGLTDVQRHFIVQNCILMLPS
jgi:hypothetical protein